MVLKGFSDGSEQVTKRFSEGSQKVFRISDLTLSCDSPLIPRNSISLLCSLSSSSSSTLVMRSGVVLPPRG